MGVKIKLNTLVKDYYGECVILGDGTTIPTRYFIWSAGMKGTFPQGLNTEIIERNARLKVNEFNQINGYTSIFAIGYLAQITINPRSSKGFPMLAQVVIQQGKWLGRNLLYIKNNQPLIPFKYKGKGTLATIGCNKAVADIGNLHITGFFA